jgi:cytochrome c553
MILRTRSVAVVVALLIIGATFAEPAAAEGDAGRGETLGYTCLGCHGVEGYRNAYPSFRVPKLGGQKAAYLVIAIKGYRDGKRSHPTMTAQASSLGDQQIEDIAAYLASMNTETVAGGGSTARSMDETTTRIACATAGTVSAFRRPGRRLQASTKTTACTR